MFDLESRMIEALEKGNNKEYESIHKEYLAKDKPANFCSYMDSFIDKLNINRKILAQRAGLSEGYTYKLLNGQSRTKARDKILLLCMALKMNLEEVQVAFDLYPFPRLKRENIRDSIIILAINREKDIDDLCTWLENAKETAINFGKDYKTDEFTLKYSTKNAENLISCIQEKQHIEERSNIMKILESRCKRTIGGPGMIAYDGEMKLQTKEGKTIFLHINHFDEDHYTVADYSIYDYMTGATEVEPERNDYLEEYDDFADALKSQYGDYFRQLDLKIDEYIQTEKSSKN